MTTPVVVIVPFHNMGAFIGDCLRSVAWQDHHPRRLIVVDDASTDEEAPAIGADGELWGRFERARSIRRQVRGGELASVIEAHALIEREWNMPDETVVCHVSGDDWLATPSALSRLAREYLDPAVWMTYGQYVTHPDGAAGHCQPIPPEWHQQADYRQRAWLTSHLRSYRLGLWRALPPAHLIDPLTGEPWFYATDRALMWPLLEMAGPGHVRFISDVLYSWRRHAGNVSAVMDGDHCRRASEMPRAARVATIYGAAPTGHDVDDYAGCDP